MVLPTLVVLAVATPATGAFAGPPARPARATFQVRAPAPAAPADPAPPPSAAATLDPYRGLGTWVSIYSRSTLADPVGAARAMRAHGVRTLFLETANFKQRVDVVRPRTLAAMVEAAHAEGLRVVAWYLPSYADLATDLRRARAAIAFRTPAGQAFDGFALDVEATVVRSIPARNRAAIRLARRLRAAVGPDHVLGAIVPEARALYWPGFPYAALARHFDVWLPMAYFTFRVDGPAAVRRWVGANLAALRATRMPVHPIGGLAEHARGDEVRAYADSVRAGGAIGAGLYDFAGTSDEDWAQLGGVAAMP